MGEVASEVDEDRGPVVPDEDVRRVLDDLSESGRAQLITRYGVRFWAASGTTYAN